MAIVCGKATLMDIFDVENVVTALRRRRMLLY